MENTALLIFELRIIIFAAGSLNLILEKRKLSSEFRCIA